MNNKAKWGLVAAMSLVGIGACGIDVLLAGKACDENGACPDGLVCQLGTNTCEDPSSTSASGGSTTSSSVGGAGGAPATSTSSMGGSGGATTTTASGGAPPTACSPIAMQADDFDSANPNNLDFDSGVVLGGGTVTVNLAAGDNAALARGRYTYDLTGADVVVEMMPDVSSPSESVIRFVVDADLALEFAVGSNMVEARRVAGANVTVLGSEGFNPMKHRYYRLRHGSDGDVSYQTSQNRNGWQTLGSTSLGATSVEHVRVEFGAEGAAAASNVTFNDLIALAPSGQACGIDGLAEVFAAVPPANIWSATPGGCVTFTTAVSLNASVNDSCTLMHTRLSSFEQGGVSAAITPAATGETRFGIERPDGRRMMFEIGGSEVRALADVTMPNVSEVLGIHDASFAYLRLNRTSAGVLEWQASPDGMVWNTVHSEMAPAVDLTEVTVFAETSVGSIPGANIAELVGY